LATRDAPLEYWFIKLHAGDLAFLVDFIIRRVTGAAEVRVSLWVRGRGRVARTLAPVRAGIDAVVVGESCFGPRGSSGQCEDISWNLAYEGGSARAAPRVPLLGGALDMSLVSYPCAVFDGHVDVAGERFDVAAAPGSVTHYWGRRLPDRWHWISATSFDGADLTLECVLLRTRLYGRRPTMSAGYLWSSTDGLTISPLTGLITVTGSRTDYRLTARGRHGTTRLHCSAPPAVYNDLGEGIHQTLLGRCEQVGSGLVDARAGLEYRG
jgi:hypothetical protein